MTTPPRAIGEIASFHAHIYFDPERTGDVAQRLRAWIAARFPLRMGRWHAVQVGPHAQAMYQVAFEPAVFAGLVAFLMLNHGGLTILIHPNTTNPRQDHLYHALWIGTPLPIRGDVLPEDAVADDVGEINTVPTIDP